MKTVIKNLTDILLNKEKISMYHKLTGYSEEFIRYKRIKLLLDLINMYNELYDNTITKSDLYNYPFTKDSFDFTNESNIYTIEKIFCSNLIIK